MSNKWENAQVKLLLKIKSYLPKSVLFYYIFLVFKLLPLIIITHDWNINYGKGISVIISHFSLCPILTKFKNQDITVYITILISALSLISFVFCLICKYKLSKHKHLNKKWKIGIRLITYFLFFIPFLFSQQIYALVVENLFSKAVYSSNLHQITSILFGNDMKAYLFYINIVVQLILIFYCVCISYLLSIIFFEPLYLSNILLTNNIGETDWRWCGFALIQFAVQLEYHLPFTIILYIKGICRGLYIIYYITWFCHQDRRYYSDHSIHRAISFILSMCFVSSIIEFVFIFDFNNNMTLLTSNVNYIVIKLCLETLLSSSIVAYSQNNEISYITCLNGKSIKQRTHSIYASFNRLFYYISNPTKNKKLTIKMFNSFYQEIQAHKLTCRLNKEKGCFCNDFLPENFYAQENNFLFVYANDRIKVSSEKKNLKDQFIFFYSYLEKLIQEGRTKKNSVNEVNEYLLVSALFYLEFDKNVTKAFYFLEAYMKSNQYRKSTICQVQVQIILKYIKDKFYLMMSKSPDKTLKQHFIDFKNVVHYIKIEKLIRKSFDSYYSFIVYCSIQGITQKLFFNYMKRLTKEIKLDNELLTQYFKRDKCMILHLCAELTLYYKYFFNKIPYDLSVWFKELTKMEELIKFESNKQLILTREKSDNSNFVIEYVSDLLLQDLSYTSIDEIAKSNFNELTLSAFENTYDNYLKEEVNQGNTSLLIPHLFLVNAHLNILLYSFKAIVMIMGSTLKVFGTLVSFDDSAMKEYNKHKAKGKEKQIKACYALISHTCRILGINDEFEKYFFINAKLISKCKINLYEDILKITSKNRRKNLYANPLSIYNHLLEVHESQMLENNQREYIETFKAVKDIISKLQRYPIRHDFVFNFIDIKLNVKGKIKEYSLVYLSIEGENKKSLWSFEKYIGTSQEKQIEVYQSYAKRNMYLNFKLEKEPEDVIEKLTLIKLQALKVLFAIQGINGDIIKNFIEKKAECGKDEFNSFIDQNETTFSSSNKAINKKLHIKSSLIVQFGILICFLILYSVVLVLITVLSHSFYSNGETIVYSGLYLQMAKRTLTVLVSIVINLQLKANNVYNETIDLFSNSDANLYSSLEYAITDYQEFLKKFKDSFGKVSGYQNPSAGFLGDLAKYEQEYIVLNKKLQSTKAMYTLSKSLNAIHYKVAKIITQGSLLFMYFNNTGRDDVTRYNPDYFNDKTFDTIGSDDFIAENSVVFLLENTLTNIRYPLIEALNRIDLLVIEHVKRSMNALLVVCLINSCLLFFLFIYQGVYYYHLNQNIFSKAFINFCYIQYFNLLLLKKTHLLREYMEVVTIESTVKTVLSRVVIKNKEEESNMIASKTEQIDAEYSFTITPFEVITEEIVLNDTAPSVNKVTNSISITPFSSMNLNNLLAQSNNSPIYRKAIRMKNQVLELLKAVINKPLQKVLKTKNEGSNNIPNANTNNSQTSINLLNVTSTQQQLQQQQQNFGDTQSNQQQTQPRNEDLGTHENIIPNSKLNEKEGTATATATATAAAVHSNKKELILKKGSIIGTIILFFIFCLYGFACSIIYYFLTSSEFKLMSNFSVVQFQTLIRLDCFHEVLSGLQLSILKNRPLMVDYNSTGFLTNAGGTKREVMVDMIHDFYYFDEKFRSMIVEEPLLKKIIEFDSIVKSEQFCQETAKLVEENSTDSDIRFSHLKELTKEEFLSKCLAIGNGFNNDGFYTAMQSLVSHGSDMYNEFKAKADRDGDYNYDKINDRKIQIHYAETFYILDFVMLKYQQALSSEYKALHLLFQNYSEIYLIIAICLIAVIALVYEERLLKIYLLEVDSLELTEILVYHTVIY